MILNRNPIKKGGGRKTLDMKLKEELRFYKQTSAAAAAVKKGWSDEVQTVDLWATTVTGMSFYAQLIDSKIFNKIYC